MSQPVIFKRGDFVLRFSAKSHAENFLKVLKKSRPEDFDYEEGCPEIITIPDLETKLEEPVTRGLKPFWGSFGWNEKQDELRPAVIADFSQSDFNGEELDFERNMEHQGILRGIWWGKDIQDAMRIALGMVARLKKSGEWPEPKPAIIQKGLNHVLLWPCQGCNANVILPFRTKAEAASQQLVMTAQTKDKKRVFCPQCVAEIDAMNQGANADSGQKIIA